MKKLIVFVALLVLGALAADWLADQSGDVVVTVAGHRIEASLLVSVVCLAALIFVVMMVYGVLKMLWRSPSAAAGMMRDRNMRKGREAIDLGLVAIGSGDLTSARRYAFEASRFAPDAPLTLLLQAQTHQLAGNREGAESAFRSMVDKPATRVLGLRGLHVEAQRRHDHEAAHALAAEAVKAAPTAAWAVQAMLDQYCAQGDWDAALDSVARSASARMIDKETAKRQKAVLLTAKAMAQEGADPALARRLALEAHGLAPALVPAAVLAGRLLAAAGETRKVTKLVEATWKLNPHPELADVYAHARVGDSARDRFARVTSLVALNPDHPESRLALARAAVEAGEWAKAHEVLDPLVREHPSQRVCLLLAELAKGENDLGKAREWTARAVRAPRDPAWTADGQVSPNWLPFSPVTGRLDAFEWKVPVQDLGVIAADLDIGVSEEPVLIEAVPDPVAPETAAKTADIAPVTVAAVEETAFRPPLPDDPGPRRPEEGTKKRFSLFGG